MRKLNTTVTTKPAKIETVAAAKKRLNATVAPIAIAAPKTGPDSVQKAVAKKQAASVANAKPYTKAQSIKRFKATKPATETVSKPAAIVGHEITASYAGASTGLNASRSRSALRLDIGSAVFTYRDDSTLRDLVAKYAGKPFARLNVDAGIIRRLASAQCLNVNASGTELTATAIGTGYVSRSKPLVPGDKIPLSTVLEIAKRKA